MSSNQSYTSGNIRQALALALQRKGIVLPAKQVIPARPLYSPTPASFAQQRLWIIDQMRHDNQYNMGAALRVRGKLIVGVMERAWQEIMNRHEGLRTSFQMVDGQVMQFISPQSAAQVGFVDLTETHDLERETQAVHLAREHAEVPFDLSAAPLVRASILKLATDDHILLLAMHHIISDGWSMGIMVREMTVLYDAFLRGLPSSLPPLPIQYADYAYWQRGWLQGEVLDRQLEYWTHQLKGLSPIELPKDYPRPKKQNYRGNRYRFLLPESVVEQLRAISQKHQATLFMTLTAAVHVLLFRYSGQHDVAIGTAIANRSRLETENLIGCFVNTLVIRGDAGGNPRCHDFLGHIRDVILDAHKHQDVPFEAVVEKLQPVREAGSMPLINVLLNWHNTPQTVLRFADLELSPFQTKNTAIKFDLILGIQEQAGALPCAFEYSTELYDEASISQLASHFCNLLRDIAADENKQLSALCLLGDAERGQLVNDWNATAVAVPECCVHTLFEEQAFVTPDAIALEFHGQSVTYMELDRRANQVANYLRELGVVPETRVGLLMERSLEMVVTLLGILKAGGAYVPLDPGYPAERLAWIAETSKLLVLIMDHKWQAIAPGGIRHAVCIDKEKSVFSGHSERNPGVTAHWRNLAYVMHTSGSTGVPKGVEVEHRSIVRLARGCNYVNVGSSETFLQFAPVAFDASTFEIWVCLLNGAKLVIHPPGTPSIQQLSQLVEESGTTVVWLTAGLFHQMVETEMPRLKGVRYLLAGGDILAVEHVRKASAACPDLRIINGYGPTENTTFSCCHPMGPEEMSELAERVPIGRPITNSVAYVLDTEMEPVPVGVTGELYVGGLGLARGYVADSPQTAARFVPNPFSNSAGERLYRTGDQVKWRHDGKLEFLGRRDQQVKIRGYRIELQEIESALLRLPDIDQAVVIARADEQGDKQLVAYVVAKQKEEGIDSVEWREALRRKLPGYMVPARYVQMNDFPLTANGKVNRNALPEWEPVGPMEGRTEAKTAVEEIVGGIFAELLKLKDIGLDENFFYLGGHSLLATQIVSRVRSAFAIELSMATIFESPTVRCFSQRVEQELREKSCLMPPPLLSQPRLEAEELSFAQQRLWFLNQWNPSSPFYNVNAGVRLHGELRVDALKRALTALFERHDALRTRFESVNGVPMQLIAADAELKLRQIDLTSLAEEEDREAQARRCLQEAAHLPYDLRRGSLVRALLLRMADQDHILLLGMHHIVSDGWSMNVLVRELTSMYEAYSQNMASPLPPLGIQYVDFARWQRAWLRGEVLDQQLAYWETQLKGTPQDLQLRTDFPHAIAHGFAGGREKREIAIETTSVVKALSRRAGATLFMTTLTVYMVLLRYHSKAKDLDDLIVGTNVANRNHLELEPLIGFFVNQLVLRLKMSGDPGFMELLARARKMVLDAFLYQEVPFEKVVEKLRPERKEKHSPFHQVLFTLVAKQDKPPVFSHIRIEEVPLATQTAKFDLTLSIIDRGETLIALLDYNAGLFKTSTIERMLRQYETLLGLVAGNPDIHLSELFRILRDADKEEQRKIAGAFKKSDLDRIRGMRSKTIAVKSTE